MHTRSQAQHKHSLEDHTWYIQQSTSNKASLTTLNTSITLNNKITTTPKYIAICFTKQITNPVRHATNIFIDRATQNIQGYNITLTIALRSKRQSNKAKLTAHKVKAN